MSWDSSRPLVPIADGVVIGTISLVAWGGGAGITPTCLWALPAVLLGGRRADSHAFAVVLTGRNLGILAGPLIAVATFRFTNDWLAVAYTFDAITAFRAVAAFYLGSLVRRIGWAAIYGRPKGPGGIRRVR